MSKFQGIYATLLEKFVDFKKSLGYKFKDAEYTYFLFDRFTVQSGETEIGIAKELADKWAVKRPNESNSTCYRRVMYLIQFTAFLNDSFYKSYIPRLTRAYKSTFTSYIFSPKEIKAIFAVSDRLKMGSFMDSTVNVMQAILHTLYSTGIRCMPFKIRKAISLSSAPATSAERKRTTIGFARYSGKQAFPMEGKDRVPGSFTTVPNQTISLKRTLHFL